MFVTAVCDCGTVASVNASSVRTGLSTNCGCVRRVTLSKAVSTHGHTKGRKTTKVLRAYWSMRSRCYNPNMVQAEIYKRKGIQVCRGWMTSGGLERFIKQMGEPPSPAHSLDRIDNNGHYSCGLCDECRQKRWPSNCRWADVATQSSNKSTNRYVLVDGVRMTATAAAKLLKLPRNRLCREAKNSPVLLSYTFK